MHISQKENQDKIENNLTVLADGERIYKNQVRLNAEEDQIHICNKIQID